MKIVEIKIACEDEDAENIQEQFQKAQLEELGLCCVSIGYGKPTKKDWEIITKLLPKNSEVIEYLT